MATVVDERALDERLARLETARSWSPRVVSRLEALIREGDDAALFRVNPLALAPERGLDPGEAVDLLLHATAQDLFEADRGCWSAPGAPARSGASPPACSPGPTAGSWR